MAKQLDKRTVVIVGGGLTAGLVARQLTASGIDVVVLERGFDHRAGAESHLPNQRDELRWDTHQGMMQDWSKETYTLRHDRAEEALPVRWMEAFLPGTGMGGAANHWNGMTWRWSEYDPVLRTRLRERYGAAAIPADMPLQDWGVTYAEMEPYHDLFEWLFGISGKAGNINGRIQPGGNPFEAPRRGEYPQPAARDHRGRCNLSAHGREHGLQAFPDTGGQLLAGLHQSGRPAARPVPVLRPLRTLHLRGAGQGDAAGAALPDAPQRKGFEIRLGAQVLALEYDRAASACAACATSICSRARTTCSRRRSSCSQPSP